MNLEELEKHVRYCIEIEDLTSLYIIQYLLYHEIETRQGIWQGLIKILPGQEEITEDECPKCGRKKEDEYGWEKQELYSPDKDVEDIRHKYITYVCQYCAYSVVKNLDTGQINIPIQRHVETSFDVSFSLLREKNFIRTDRNKMNAFMLALEKPPEKYPQTKITEIQQLCLKIIDERIGVFGWDEMADIDAPIFIDDTDEAIRAYEEIARQTKEDSQSKNDFRKIRKYRDIDFRDFKELDFIKKESTEKELREKIKETLEKITEDNSALFNTGDDLEWIKNKPKEEQNCIHIKSLLDATEKQLRELLIWKGFEISKNWLPKGLIDKKEFIRKKQETALKQFSGNPKILTPERQFLNAITLGELIEIIIYTQRNHKIFSDVFEDFKQMEVYFLKELKILRDQMAHNDEQISCTDDLVAKTKTVTNEINSQILAWRGI